ncbi:MAG: flagellar hook-basal body protein [Nitrospira sp.]|nr:flagellar hook-basal body protein [Nitrospira sp.]
MYIALSGAVLRSRYNDVFAQNIANADTTGYKKQRVSFKDHLIQPDNRPAPVNNGRTMSELSSVYTDHSQGAMISSGNELDLAIDGEGFFALEGNRYTRDGSFHVNVEGEVVTSDGIRVLGEGGTLTVGSGKIDINPQGEVFVDAVLVGTIRLDNFTDKTELKNIGDNLFESTGAGEPSDAGIMQGYLESSNVEAVREMVQMLSNLREFEAYQKMIQMLDEMKSVEP